MSTSQHNTIPHYTVSLPRSIAETERILEKHKGALPLSSISFKTAKKQIDFCEDQNMPLTANHPILPITIKQRLRDWQLDKRVRDLVEQRCTPVRINLDCPASFVPWRFEHLLYVCQICFPKIDPELIELDIESHPLPTKLVIRAHAKIT